MFAKMETLLSSLEVGTKFKHKLEILLLTNIYVCSKQMMKNLGMLKLPLLNLDIMISEIKIALHVLSVLIPIYLIFMPQMTIGQTLQTSSLKHIIKFNVASMTISASSINHVSTFIKLIFHFSSN